MLRRHAAASVAMGLCALYLVGALWLAQGRGRGLTPDAAYYAIVARNLARGDGYAIDLIGFHTGWFESIHRLPEMHGLLTPIVLAPLFALFGVGSVSLHAPSIVYVALSGLLGFAFARRLFGAAAGVLACVLILGSGRLFYASWGMADDAGFAFFFLCSLYALYRGLTDERDAWFLAAGCAAGVGLLQKLTGLFLPGVFVGAMIVFRSPSHAVTLRRTAYLLVPLALCLSVYLARNLAAHGGLAFRFGAVDWYWKTGGEAAAFALYETAPTLIGVLEQIGWVGAARIALGQLAAFPVEFFRLSWPTPGGPGLDPMVLAIPSLFVHFRSHFRFATLCLLCLLGSVLFICILYHMEPRYFSMLIPLLSISLAGALVIGARGMATGWPRRLIRAASIAASLILLFSVMTRTQLAIQLLGASRGVAHVDECAEFLSAETGPEERILTLDPWSTTWISDRPSVFVPSGGLDPILEVIRHYETRWLLLRPSFGRAPTHRALSRIGAGGAEDLRSELVFEGTHCQIYSLSWPPRG